ncbi:MAG: hypothetical protein PHQ12_06755 [Chthoniobacteraceae bacterium]|nr:hypothetical protein [Chthoniobacteraceae bacterium]
MALTVHQLALRLAKYLGVTAFDPGDRSNTDPLVHAALRPGDLDDVVACLNGALQEFWELAPRGVRALYPEGCPAVTAADVGAATDPGVTVLLPAGWEESILFPLALRRLSAHPDFQQQAAKPEIERQAAWATRIILGLEEGRPEAASIGTGFR